jgi:hypothetical protein
MMLWLSLNKDEAGVILTKTLEIQTDNAPAQYQFKHLSFQEGLYAQHLLQTILALKEHRGSAAVWEVPSPTQTSNHATHANIEPRHPSPNSLLTTLGPRSYFGRAGRRTSSRLPS